MSGPLTPANESEKAEVWFHTALDMIRDAVIAVDSNHDVIWINTNAQRLMGYEKKPIHGQPLTKLFVPLDPETKAPMEIPSDQVLTKRKPIRVPMGLLKSVSLKNIPIEFTMAPVESGEHVKGFVIVFHEKSPVETDGSKAPDKIRTDQKRLKKEKILVMDDDEMLRSLTSQKLNRLGYRVDTAVDMPQAVSKYQTAWDKGDPFDVVILDLVIRGGPGGKETIAKLRQINPNIKAIISSGYSNDPALSNFWEYGFSAVAHKPYAIMELDRIIRQLADEGE